MTSLAIFAPSRASHLHLRGIHGENLHIQAMKEEVKFPPSRFTATGLQNDRSFEAIRGGEQPPAILADAR